jgi:hypothetical protein
MWPFMQIKIWGHSQKKKKETGVVHKNKKIWGLSLEIKIWGHSQK